MYLQKEDKRVSTRVDKYKADVFAALMLDRLGGKANYMKLMKLLYFADRYHMRRYLRPIAKDDLYAMQKGPTASFWLNILRGLRESKFLESDKVSQVHLKNNSWKEPLVILSESELEAMDFALTNFAKFTPDELVDITHEYPEWAKYKEHFREKGGRKDIDLRDILEDPQEDNPVFKKLKFKDPFPPLTEEDKILTLETLEDFAIESM